MGATQTPVRRCIADGRILPTVDLIRFVVGPNDEIVPDIDGRLPGRGLWVSATKHALATAINKELFSRAARRRVAIPDGLIRRVEDLLIGRCQSRLGLARRAGGLVLGFEKVRAMIRRGEAAVLIGASDAGADGRSKVSGLDPSLERVSIFTREELSLAVGRENVVHAALARGRLATTFVADSKRLAGFRLEDVVSATPHGAASPVNATRLLSENAGL